MLILTTPKQHTLHRLKICAGHLQAIQKQIENDQDCLAVVNQTKAVKNALKQIELLLIKDYLQKHSISPQDLKKAIKLISSSSLHLPTSTIHQY
jgi:DNA-binding FrmR family transcriptional regulator